MNELMDKFVRLPTSQKALAAVVLYALVIGGYLWGMWMPAQQKLEQLESTKKTLVAEREETRKISENLDKFRLEVESLNEDLTRALKELPNDREIDKLLKSVATIGKKIGLEFLLFQPLPEVMRDFYAEVPVQIEVSGSYHEVAMFFDRVGKLSRIVNIEDVQMAKPQERGGKIILKTSGKATTYRFVADEELADKDAKGKKGKRRKKKRKKKKKH